MEIKTHFTQNRNWLSIAGLILLLVPISIWILWIGTFSSNPSASQADKVAIFLSYFPSFLRSISSTSLMVVVSAIGSVILTVLGRKSANRVYRIAGKFVIIAAILVLLLQIFTML